MSSHTISTSTICRRDGVDRKKKLDLVRPPFPNSPPNYDPSIEKEGIQSRLLDPTQVWKADSDVEKNHPCHTVCERGTLCWVSVDVTAGRPGLVARPEGCELRSDIVLSHPKMRVEQDSPWRM